MVPVDENKFSTRFVKISLKLNDLIENKLTTAAVTIKITKKKFTFFVCKIWPPFLCRLF